MTMTSGWGPSPLPFSLSPSFFSSFSFSSSSSYVEVEEVGVGTYSGEEEEVGVGLQTSLHREDEEEDEDGTFPESPRIRSGTLHDDHPPLPFSRGVLKMDLFQSTIPPLKGIDFVSASSRCSPPFSWEMEPRFASTKMGALEIFSEYWYNDLCPRLSMMNLPAWLIPFLLQRKKTKMCASTSSRSLFLSPLFFFSRI